MSLLSRLLFADEFVVDQKPEPLAPLPSAKPGKEGEVDLVTGISEMARFQEELRQLNETLQRRQNGQSVEMDRFVRRFLSRLDGFDRILEAFRSMEPSKEVNNWLQSIEGLYFKIQQDMANVGLEPLEVVGKEVDLDFMEVVDYRFTNNYPHNSVISEMKRGYRYKGKVLRDTQVVVARNERG